MNEFETKLNNFIKQHNKNIDNKVLDKIDYEVNPRPYPLEVFCGLFKLNNYMPQMSGESHGDYIERLNAHNKEVAEWCQMCVNHYPMLYRQDGDEHLLHIPDFEPIDTLLQFYRFNHTFTQAKYFDKVFFRVLADSFTAMLLESIGCPELIGEFNSSKQYNKVYVLVANSLLRFMFISLYGITGEVWKWDIHESTVKAVKYVLYHAQEKGIIPFKLTEDIEPMQVKYLDKGEKRK